MTAERHSTPIDGRRLRRSGRRLLTACAGVLGLALVVTLVPPVAQAATAPAPVPRPIVTGWMPYWTSDASTASVVPNADLFTEVSPFWYSAVWSGGTSAIDEQVSASSKASVLAALRTAGVKVVPAITDGMPAKQMAAVMASPSARAKLVSQLVNLVVTNGYDGLDLDFERFAFSDGRSTWPTTRPAWVAFVAALSAGLHAKGKLLTATTPPLYDATRSTTSGYWVYDWAGIGAYVDRLRIMAYDYSVSGGNIAPYAWVEKIVAFAVTQVASGKIQVGVPAYGRNAVTRARVTPSAPLTPKVVGTCPTNRPSNYLDTLAFTAANATTSVPTVATTSATVTRTAAARAWDPVTREVRFSYTVTYIGTTAANVATSCTVYRSGWYDNADSVVARAGLVGKYRLAGIAQWTLGGEEASQWSRLRAYAKTIAPTPTVVRLTAPVAATYGTRLSVRAVATAAGVPVEGATATLYRRRTGTTAYTAVATAVTSAAGVAAFAPGIATGTDYRINVTGTYSRTAGWGIARVQVRTAVLLAANSTLVVPGRPVTITSGQTVRISVALGPRVARQKVLRQMVVAGRWITQATTYANSAGRAAFSVRPTSRGNTYHYRIVAQGTSSVVTGSAALDVRVR